MKSRQLIVLLMVFALFAGLAAWLQFAIVQPSAYAVSATQANSAEDTSADYWIENFVSVGIDQLGKKYQLSADRLVYDSRTERAELQRPRLIQYATTAAARYLQADSGVLYNDGAELLLYGNVKETQAPSATAEFGGGTIFTTNKMLLRLKRSATEYSAVVDAAAKSAD